MRRALRNAAVLVVLAAAIGVSAMAVAMQNPFVDLDTVLPADAQTSLDDRGSADDPGNEGEMSVVDLSEALTRPPSLEEVAGLPPYEWPWFAQGVQTPADAVADAPDLIAAMAQIVGFESYKVLSAERIVYPGGPDLEWRRAWLRVNDNELLRVGTQILTDDTIIPLDYANVVDYAGGTAQYRVEERRINLVLAVGSRLVTVDTVLITGAEGPLSLTSDELLRIAKGIIDNI
ncbi:MAG: hypothetical protein WEE36_05830 [Acidimicrobiia bacterium]